MCTVYLGKSKTDNKPEKQVVSLEKIYELLSKPRVSLRKDGPYILTVSLGDSGKRNEKNVIAVEGFFLDFDKGIDEFTIRKKLEGVEFFAHTTYSHSPETPRWRVFIPYAEPYPTHLHKQVYMYMVDLFSGHEIDQRCKTASQLWYLPTCSDSETFRSFHVEGNYFNPEAVAAVTDAEWEEEVEEVEKGTFRVPVGQRDQWFFDQAVQYRLDGRLEQETLAALETLRGDPTITEQPKGNAFTARELAQKVKSVYREEYEIGKEALASRIKALSVEEQMEGEMKLPTIKEREEKWFKNPPEAPKVLLPGLLQNDVMLFNAAGGGTKTTLTLWMQIRIILGKEIFERQANRTGGCLYITAEDKSDRIDYRIHKLCEGMDLTRSEQRHVAKRLFVENWRGLNRRFMESDRNGNLQNTTWCQFLIDKYMNSDLAMVVIDPIVLFSPGERFGNDGWSSLMALIGLMAEELGDINALCCHHTGQDSYRRKERDQYSGRGATANADQSRGVLTANYYSAEEDHALVPPQITDFERDNGLVIRVDAGKLSDEPRSKEPLWAVRGHGDSWEFRTYKSAEPDVAELAKKEKVKRKQEFNVEKIVDYIKALPAQTYPTKNFLDTEFEVLGMSRRDIRDAIERGLHTGALVKRELPEEHVRGARKDYIASGEMVRKMNPKPKKPAE